MKQRINRPPDWVNGIPLVPITTYKNGYIPPFRIVGGEGSEVYSGYCIMRGSKYARRFCDREIGQTIIGNRMRIVERAAKIWSYKIIVTPDIVQAALERLYPDWAWWPRRNDVLTSIYCNGKRLPMRYFDLPKSKMNVLKRINKLLTSKNTF